MKKSSRSVSPELFVQLYCESAAAGHTMSQLAERLGWSYGHTHSRVRYYKKRGWKAPPLTRQKRDDIKPVIDVDRLNAITAAEARRIAGSDDVLPRVQRVNPSQLAASPNGWSSIHS